MNWPLFSRTKLQNKYESTNNFTQAVDMNCHLFSRTKLQNIFHFFNCSLSVKEKAVQIRRSDQQTTGKKCK